MSSAGHKLKTLDAETVADRPGWIPAHITHDWDPDPYAYQTEEELMPGGPFQTQIFYFNDKLVRDTPENLSRHIKYIIDLYWNYRHISDTGKNRRIYKHLKNLGVID